jgi:ribonuclease HII
MLKKRSLAELRAFYVEGNRPLPRVLEVAMRADSRPGVQDVLRSVLSRRRSNRSEGQRLRTMLRFERELWQRGIAAVAGVDEAGMSPFAGPVAAGAVVLAPGTRLPDVDDSKRLSESERERLAPIIRAQAVAWAVAFVEPAEIDRINIYRAGLLAMQRAVEALAIVPDFLLIDARRLKDVPIAQNAIVGGDGKSLSIAAASVLAKTARDARMREIETVYAGYGFSKHKGYGTREHVEALRRLGVTPIHRMSFAPVREVHAAFLAHQQGQ